jgi:hypothetical protein
MAEHVDGDDGVQSCALQFEIPDGEAVAFCIDVDEARAAAGGLDRLENDGATIKGNPDIRASGQIQGLEGDDDCGPCGPKRGSIANPWP